MIERNRTAPGSSSIDATRLTGVEGRATAIAVVIAMAGAAMLSAWLILRPIPFSLTSDNRTSEYPLLADTYRQLSFGAIPLWTSGRWGGSPLIGDPLTGALYPPYHVSFALTEFPHRRALDLSAAFHLVFLAAGMVLFLRMLGVRVGVALAVTIIFACNPTVVFIARTWAELWAAMTYWPWLFAAALQVRERPRLGWALLGSVSLAGQVYAGYGQFALYSGCVSLIWVLLKGGPGRTHRFTAVALMGLAGIGLAAPQVLPALDMAKGSIRMGPRSAELMGRLDVVGLSPELWWEAVRPTAFNVNPSKLAPIVLLPIPFALIGRHRAGLFFGGVAAITAFLATVPNPIYRGLQTVPPFNFFGAPVKFFYFTVFVLAVLSALGLEGCSTMSSRWRRGTVIAAAVLAAFALAEGFPDQWIIWSGPLVLLCALPSRLLNAGLLAGVVVGGVAFLAAAEQGVRFDPVRMGAFNVLIEEDLKTGIGEELDHPGRFVALRGGVNLLVGSNFGALWNIETLNGIGPLYQWRQYESCRYIPPGRVPLVLRQWGADPVAVAAGSRLAKQLLAAGFRRVGFFGDLVILSSPQPAPPRYVLVPHAHPASATDAITLARLGTGLTEQHVVIEASSLRAGTNGDPRGQVEILHDTPPSVRLRVSVDRPTWLVARQPYYRNWRAAIDGKPSTVYPAGGFYLGTLIPEGDHELRLSYEEPGLWTGLIIALVTIVALPFLWHRLQRHPTAA